MWFVILSDCFAFLYASISLYRFRYRLFFLFLTQSLSLCVSLFGYLKPNSIFCRRFIVVIVYCNCFSPWPYLISIRSVSVYGCCVSITMWKSFKQISVFFDSLQNVRCKWMQRKKPPTWNEYSSVRSPENAAHQIDVAPMHFYDNPLTRFLAFFLKLLDQIRVSFFISCLNQFFCIFFRTFGFFLSVFRACCLFLVLFVSFSSCFSIYHAILLSFFSTWFFFFTLYSFGHKLFNFIGFFFHRSVVRNIILYCATLKRIRRTITVVIFK